MHALEAPPGPTLPAEQERGGPGPVPHPAERAAVRQSTQHQLQPTLLVLGARPDAHPLLEMVPTVTDAQEKVDLARMQFRKSLEVKGIPRGILETRRHFSNYFKGLPDFREIRMKLVTSLDTKEIERLLDHILTTYLPN